MRATFFLGISLLLSPAFVAGSVDSPEPETTKSRGEMVLWYRQPGQRWLEGLPLGNGIMGAMVFGGVPQERIALNEGTFWSGRPHDYNNPEAHQYFPPDPRPRLRREVPGGGEDGRRALLRRPRGAAGLPTARRPPAFVRRRAGGQRITAANSTCRPASPSSAIARATPSSPARSSSPTPTGSWSCGSPPTSPAGCPFKPDSRVRTWTASVARSGDAGDGRLLERADPDPERADRPGRGQGPALPGPASCDPRRRSAREAARTAPAHRGSRRRHLLGHGRHQLRQLPRHYVPTRRPPANRSSPASPARITPRCAGATRTISGALMGRVH